MLRRLSANKDEFKPVEFGTGLNLIVADRAPGASEQHSRNARGKTSLISAINYCLGSNRPTSFRALADAGWTFTLELDLLGSHISATRAVAGGTRVILETTDGSPNVVLAEYMREDGSVSLAEWKQILGLGLFGLEEEPEGAAQGISPRTLLSYVIRLEAPKDPTKFMAQQPAWSSRQHISFLLGLDWKYIQELSRMRRDEEAFKALSYASEVQLVPGLIGDESDLLIKHAQIERELNEARLRADSFVVLDDPEGTLLEANRTVAEATLLSDAQVTDERLLQLYRESLDEPDEGDDENLVGNIYEELGLVFSPQAMRRFDQVAAFHQSITRNRRRFIQVEIDRLEQDIENRRPQIEQLQALRQNLLRRLSSGGAIDDLLDLQQQVAELKGRLEAVDDDIQLVRNVQAAKDSLQVREATCRRDAREALNRDRAFLDAVNARFSEVIAQLYGRSASITVDVDELGYKFSVKVSGSSSSGITKMQLFAFDLTLLEQSRLNHHPHFLIHDSIVFDGVDPRQIAGALNLARSTAERVEAQYIITMNTNDIPESIAQAEWYEDCIRRVILDTETGGAFGVTFS